MRGKEFLEVPLLFMIGLRGKRFTRSARTLRILCEVLLGAGNVEDGHPAVAVDVAHVVLQISQTNQTDRGVLYQCDVHDVDFSVEIRVAVEPVRQTARIGYDQIQLIYAVVKNQLRRMLTNGKVCQLGFADGRLALQQQHIALDIGAYPIQ